MESEINHISSNYFDKSKFQTQIDIIKKASEEATIKLDYYTAHDEDILYAVSIIEKFLKRTHRLCYGGQAINAYLPAKYRFYNPEYSIPDYDFFTPSQYTDIISIVNDLKTAGFSEVSVREGMHEGTVKIYVNYIPIADLTVIDSSLYRTLSKRETRIDGISYLDANTLRMLMYLELSRPRGEVTRWPKVFERLTLFNEFIPVKPCRITHSYGGLNINQLQFAINFIIKNKRIFAGADLLDFYNTSLKTRKLNTKWVFTTKKPIIFYSPEPEMDANLIRAEFKFMSDKPVTIKSYSSKGIDIIPSMKIISLDKNASVFIIHETGCNSYLNIPVKNESIRIASMDTLITLYFSLGLASYFDMGSMECLANKLVSISLQARINPSKFPLPFISIKCTGHQSSLPSLIREKVKRIIKKRTQKRENGKATGKATGKAVNKTNKKWATRVKKN
jgi:hypothetical protein